MVDVDIRSLSVCIQALQRAIRFNDFLSQSQTVDEDDHAESSHMYELELSRLIEIYKREEKLGRVDLPLSELLHPPFDQLLTAEDLEPEQT